jgi:predicted nucleotidyltransferase
VELPPDIAQLLGRLRDGLLARGGLVGIYLYGSLVTGDFSPARSDIDVIVMVEREPDNAAIPELRRLHATLASRLGGSIQRGPDHQDRGHRPAGRLRGSCMARRGDPPSA